MGKKQIAGTVKLYQRHLFVSTRKSSWPSKIEKGGGFLQKLHEAIHKMSDKSQKQIKVTAFHDPLEHRSLILFPEQIRYSRVRKKDLGQLVDSLFEGQICEHLDHSKARGTFIFICTHGRRDKRCGTCGPPLLARFQKEIEAKGLEDVWAYGTSHVGGHKFAGNVLVFPQGNWYGNVGSSDVRKILEAEVLDAGPPWRLWRGRMGMSPEEQLSQAE